MSKTTYAVKVINVFSEVVTVEATDEESAREAAALVIEDTNRDAVNVYENTLPTHHWAVITKEAYDSLVEDFTKLADEMGTERAEPREVTGFNPRVVR